ncbi:MAG: hypothetical protein HC795_12705 [Coleofasciculaceae cyanobacterium RL_1_1]|nr:hypothetical protein [Coleofasciculaceae cyanobacterium RL_1_1]
MTSRFNPLQLCAQRRPVMSFENTLNPVSLGGHDGVERSRSAEPTSTG